MFPLYNGSSIVFVSSWNYREGPLTHPKKTMVIANVAAAGMWWWILWHLWHEYEHITVSHDG
jgi:NADH dehydrogenase (ubiquinone) 1 beta subcomplex subunit 2